jgi:hypothetical protein
VNGQSLFPERIRLYTKAGPQKPSDMHSAGRLLIILCGLAFSLANARAITAEQFAKLPGTMSWKTNVAVPTKFRLQFFALRNGVETLFYEMGTGKELLPETPTQILMGTVEGSDTILIHTTSQLGVGKTESTITVPVSTKRLVIPLPEKIREGDYMLLGEKKPPNAPGGDVKGVKGYAKGIFMRVKKEGK